MLTSNTHERTVSTRFLLVLGAVSLGLIALTFVALLSALTGVSIAALAGAAANWLFAANTVQAMWYVTRAAGLTAYLLLWLSTAWGLAVASKILDPVVPGPFTYDFHQFLALLAIGFTALHVIVLVGDQYLPFPAAAILIPFVAPYRPLWVGIGVIALYLTLLVSVTFYMRKRIGMKTFRAIHLASFAAYGGAALHGLMAGTDSPLAAVQLMYAGTTLVIVFLTVYWYIMQRLSRRPAPTRA